METSNSHANHAVLHAQNDRRGLGPRETSYSGHNVAVVNAKRQMRAGTHRDLNFGAKCAVLYAKNLREVRTHRDL